MEISSEFKPTLLFIPDISGYTKFVNETEIHHSRHIIQELLEILIDANEINLEVSEIEGDAILLFRQGIPPTAVELLAQVQKMYVKFHGHLKKYTTHRICHCGACSTANNLKLKFIVHYGESGKNNIKEFSKLFGKDLIVAHRLLKNQINYQEYVLLSHQLINACSSWVEIQQIAWSIPEQGADDYDFGKVDYCYLSLSPLWSHVPEPSIVDYSLPGATTKVMEKESIIEAPINLVFDVLSDLSARHLWMDGVKGSDKLNSKISRIGSTHRCVMKGDNSDPFLVSHNFNLSQDYITFTDTDQKVGFCSVFTLRRIGSFNKA
ncbi:hypothetical protein BH23BAC1_BH23BAC1_31400 [soil metagenome]